jgi:peptide/nickel transport system substrate-binding protein
VYARILRFEASKFPDPISATPVPDAVSGWEVSGDGLTYTFKVRPNQKFDPRPPTNNRVMNAGDFKYSWERFVAKNPTAPTLAQKASKVAPVISLDAVDNSTVVMKLAYPSAPFLALLAYWRHVIIFPVEADGGYETGREARGSGAWRVKEELKGSRLVMEANPDWYDASKMFLAGRQFIALPEYAAALAQFRAGNLGTYGVEPEDVLQTKSDLPQLSMIAETAFKRGSEGVRFGFLETSPFRDTRLRQAISMMMDRDLLIDTIYATDLFKNAGLEPPRRWSTVLSPGYDGFWLDPRDTKLFGENSKYFAFNQAEARKLVEAATGAKLPVVTKLTYDEAEDVKTPEILQQMWQVGGLFEIALNPVPDTTEWRPNYNRSFGKYEGISGPSAGGSGPDVDVQISARLSIKDERAGHRLDDGSVDQYLEDLIGAQKSELDPEKRVQIVYEIQRHCAKQCYYLDGYAGHALGYQLAWPWLGNFGAFNIPSGGSADSELYTHYWIDESKRKA